MKQLVLLSGIISLLVSTSLASISPIYLDSSIRDIVTIITMVIIFISIILLCVLIKYAKNSLKYRILLISVIFVLILSLVWAGLLRFNDYWFTTMKYI